MNEQQADSALRVDEQFDGFRVRYRTGAKPIGCFLAFWMCGWTVACVLLGNAAYHDPEFRNLAGVGVFWTGWIFCAMILVRQIFGRETITLSADGAAFSQGGLWRTRRLVPSDELIEFRRLPRSRGQASDQQPRADGSLELRSVGRPIRFGNGLSKYDEGRLLGLLRDAHRRLKQKAFGRSPWPDDAETIVFRRSAATAPTSDVAVRTPRDPALGPPSDTRMRVVDEFDAVRFRTRGRFMPGGILVIGFFNLFWNGITGVFVYNLYWGGPQDQPQGLEWYEMFFILIPFQLVGLALLVGLVVTAAEPFRAWTHWFGQAEIRDALTWLGLGFRKRFRIGLLDRLEVRRVPYAVPKFPRRLPLATLWSPEHCPTYSLVPIEMGDRDVSSIDGLTLGEACWMADVLVRRADLPWVE